MRRACLLLTVALAVSTVIVGRTEPRLDGPGIESGPVSYNGHSYYLLGSSSWKEAEAAAVSLGGHLVTINDAAEDAFVYSTFSGYGGISRSLWIGLTDEAVEGTFGWISGEDSSYRNWAAGEPNNDPGNPLEQEDYVHIYSPGASQASHWNDVSGMEFATSPSNGVVEVGGVVPPPPPPAAGCDFNTDLGWNIRGKMVRGIDGQLYGTTYLGGTHNLGTIFRYKPGAPPSERFVTVHSFDNVDGRHPIAGLTLGQDGKLYGSTFEGGSSSFGAAAGTLFRLNTLTGEFETFHYFNPETANSPNSALVELSPGVFYGTTRAALYGTPGGTVFRFDFNKPEYDQYLELHRWENVEGRPFGDLQYMGGYLYGVIARGEFSTGSIYRISPALGDPSYSVLYEFSGLDGASPVGGLTDGGDGKLYGTTHDGGPWHVGTVFRFDPSNNELTTLHTFPLDSGTGLYLTGGGPFAQLTKVSNGVLRGTTTYGGTNDYGTVFEIASGTVTTIASFTEATGAYPFAPLTTDGYTATTQLAGNGYGAIVQVGGGITVGHSLSGVPVMRELWEAGLHETRGSLVRDDDGFLYGTSYWGGASNFGTIFKCDPVSGTGSVVYQFGYDPRQGVHLDDPVTGNIPPRGLHPLDGLAIGVDGKFYGTTDGGGNNGAGTVFRLDSAGTLETIHHFDWVDGSHPRTGLVRAGDDLFGTTAFGGTDDGGTLFRIASSGAFTNLYMFSLSQSAGRSPLAPLTLGSDGMLYGTTSVGPALFRLDPASGALSVPYAGFTASDQPFSTALTPGPGGWLYGTTGMNSTYPSGSIFRVHPVSATREILHVFGASDPAGFEPLAPLTVAANGSFYGTTSFGGSGNGGTVYRFDPLSRAVTTIHAFGSTDEAGHHVIGPVIEIAPNVFRGTAPLGRPGTHARVFEVTDPTPAIDLRLTVTDAPDPIAVGGALTFTMTVTNLGTATANGLTVTDALPSSLTFTSVSTSQGSCSGSTNITCALGALAASGHIDITLIVSATAAGTVTNTVSLSGAEPDGDPLNNTVTSSTTVVASPTGRDLIETVVSNPPALLSPGTPFTVTDTARNQGTVDAGTSTTRYYFSLDALKGAGDSTLSGSRAVPALPVGIESTGTASLTVPKTMALGTYRLLACADDTKLVVEVNESNNCVAALGSVTVGLPDLVETPVGNPPPTAAPGSTFTAADTVQNAGSVTAGASKTAYYLSADGVKDAGDVVLSGTRSIDVLAPGATSPGTKVVTIPAGLALGTYRLLACADDLIKVAETSETNNCAASSGTVTVAWPDLVTGALSNPPADAVRGGQFTLTDTVANQGGAAAAASTTRYYLSADTVKNAGDLLLTGTRSVVSLSPGATSTGSKKVTVPTAAVFGTYYVLACADDLLKVGESDNGNNCRASITTVIIHP